MHLQLDLKWCVLFGVCMGGMMFMMIVLSQERERGSLLLLPSGAASVKALLLEASSIHTEGEE
jgi:hypothetical protein